MHGEQKSIRLSKHARDQLQFRGTSEGEVVAAIRGAAWQPAESGRFDCRMNFEFKSIWNSRHYEAKQVRPIFVEEDREIVVITVYVYYF